MKDLEEQFHRAMIEVYENAKAECGYNAIRFLRMVSEKGGLSTAKILLASNNPSDGFTALWERDCLKFSMEVLVLKPKFASLFTNFDILPSEGKKMPISQVHEKFLKSFS